MLINNLNKKRLQRFIVAVGILCFSFVPVWAAGDGWNRVVSRGDLTLDVDFSSGACKVIDNRSKTEWSSMLMSGTEQNYFWKTAYRSAFVVRYLDQTELKSLYTGQSDCKIAVKRIANGVRCRFSFLVPRLSFTADYILNSQNDLIVNIPFKEINDPKKGLIDIRILPYLGHIPIENQGYIVLPDGCGGIIRSGHLKSIAYNASRVYGERFYWTVERERNNPYGSNRRYINFYDYSNPNTINLNLPVFGSVIDKAGVMGTISQGSEQAQIGPEITPSDFVLSVSSRLLIRELTYDMFTRPHASSIFKKADRTVTYHFLNGEEASYSGIALEFRRKFFASYKRNQFHAIPRLRIFFGVERKYKDTRELLRLTSFHQAEGILEDLHRSGVRNLQVVLVGWSRRGYLGDEPAHFPPDRKFGGWYGLKSLIRTSKKLGYSMGLQFDNTNAWKSSSRFRRADTVKDIQNIAVELGDKSEEYLRCPKPAWSRFLKEELPQLHRLGIDGTILFSGPERGMITCMDSNHSVGSPQNIHIFQEALTRIRKDNAIGVIGGMEYGYKFSDSIWDLPSSCSSICDQPIPLTPMILHGIVGYSFEPINMRRDSRRELLRMIEYGGIPNAFFTAKTVEDLSEARFNVLFSGKYTDWRRPFLAEYHLFQDKLRPLQGLAIIGHEKVAQGIYITRYEGNIEILVNYSASNYTYKGISVKSLSYHIYR